MDALTRRQFDKAMFAKERTLAIRVGDYASRDIKEASFEYGYIKGDTYKPGGTCAGSGKITFTSIITTFNKLDTLHPEIGLLVGDTYQWVKMGEYFINDIEIDRNRNTTTLELMDGMFKLNREYVTDLHFPAEVREVIQEICLKTGIELANDYFGISAMRYHIEQVPEGKKLSFRDMLSAMTQMIGMSCFFNREGKMEIRDLTESNITINADSYFLHGLTKSEIEYQIAGITCKTDKKSLTVGMKTGRSLELDNVFMTQSALNDLYYKLKNLTYYPYNLNYQGHLLLEVGQWVTIQTNKKETFKVPVLSQSFTFKGGLRGRISADSKAGNDTQYSYEGTITKQIKQQDGVEAKIQAQIEAADKDFDQKVDKIKKDFNDQVELTKARAEEVKRELSDTINQRFNSFDNGPLKETKRKAEEALRNAGASTLLAQEAKRIGLDSVARLEAFKSQTTSAQTALSGDLDALKRTIANDIRPKQAQAETEIAKQAEALSRTKNELSGASTLLAQEAKRIELDSVARLEAFKSQTTSAQTALSGDLDVLKRTIANDIRPKQAQAEAEIAKQVEVLSRTKNELAGVKSAQATYEETTTRRLSELTNLANGKASKSELTQTAEELLNQKLSQAEFEVRAGSIRQEILNATKDKADKTLVVSEAGKLREEFSKMKVGGRNLWIKSKTVGAVIEKLPENHVTGQKECYRLENNSTLMFNIEPDFSSRLYQKVTFSAWVKYENVVQGRNFWNVFNCFKHYLFRKNSETGVQSGPDYATLGMYKGSADWKYITFTYDYSEKTNFDQLKTSLRFNLEGATSGTAWVTGIKVEIGSVATDWSPAPEDADGLITEAKATFERTAQGLRTDLSAIQEYVNKDGQRQEALQRYTREESTRQATAVRELVNRDFVGKATYQEDVKGINQRIEAVKTSANKDIASQIASYRQSVDGKFTDISSQITTYKQDVGGQISGLSNRLTSSEQGTTTQISNISNRINSNKQGTDNQISNLKTQVATNKDNAERQMGRISDQVSANKANADSQFANVTNQLARKVETTDFQRVKETSKLYERILGNTENGIADKVARMALTNQLFQVEVGKYSVSGPNLIKNSDFKNATNEWGSTQNLGRLVKHSFYHNGQKDLMRLSNATKNENFLYSHRFNLERNTDYVLNFRGFNNSALASYDVYILGRRAGESDGFTIVKKVVSSKKLSTSRCEDVSVTFNSGEMDNAYIRFDNNGSSSGTADLYITEVDLYKGYKPRTWQPHPEDAVADANKKLEATQTKMTQLAGSWVVENINSAGDIISGINLGANGHNRLVGKLTHITGETLIDRAVIKSAMVDKLKTANFEAGSVTTTILEAEAVTAEKLKVDNALIKKLTATDAFIDQLISKRIFSTKVESVISSSTFLEAYQGRIGGFTLGQFDQGGGRWISGVNQFSVGMGNGAGYGVRTAFWANWGNNWNYAGPKAWNVNTDGKMYCRNEVGFYDQVDFSNSSRANFYGNTTFSRSPVFSNGIELGSKDVLGDGWNPKGGRNAVVWWNQVGSGSLKYWMEQKSDRRLKENITDTAVKALDKINRLRMVAFDFIENKKHEEIGLIAQEAETIVPRIVSRDPENPDGYLHIDYTALVPYLIKAIQELNQKIEKMEKTIA
ncbi:PblB-type protein, partial [Streptococcus phage 34117]